MALQSAITSENSINLDKAARALFEIVQKYEESWRLQQLKRQNRLWDLEKKFQNNERRKLRRKKQSCDWNIGRKQKTLKLRRARTIWSLYRKLKEEKKSCQFRFQNGGIQHGRKETRQWRRRSEGKILELYKIQKMSPLRKVKNHQGQNGGIQQRKMENGKILKRGNVVLIFLDVNAMAKRGIG